MQPLRVDYRIHKSPPPVPILSQINPVHAPHHTFWRSILLLSSQIRLVLPSSLFPSGLPTKTLYASLLFPIRATCPAYFIILGLITRMLFGEQHRSLSSSLYNTISHKIRIKNTWNWADFFSDTSVFPYQHNSTSTPPSNFIHVTSTPTDAVFQQNSTNKTLTFWRRIFFFKF